MKILIIRLSSLGDIILTQPACAVLQKKYPGCEIHYLCKPEYDDLPALFTSPVKVIPYAKNLQFHLELSKTHYDLVLDLHAKLASYLVMLFCNGKRKVVYDKQRSLRKAIVAGKTRASIDSTVSLYFSALKKLGIQDTWQYPQLLSSELVDSDKRNTVKQIACFPGATHNTKRWPIEHWVELINSLPQYDFSLLGSKGDRYLCKEITDQCGSNCRSKAGEDGFAALYARLQGYEIIISGDTGPMHLAAATGKPQIAIFGGTHHRLGFKPLNPRAIVLSEELSCQPCSLHGLEKCPQGHFSCMKSITPQKVKAAIQKILVS